MAKLTLTDGTIFEGTTEEIFAITERFNGVKADEPIAETLTHNGVDYTLVDRKAQAGDVVIPTGESSSIFVTKDTPYIVETGSDGQLEIEGYDVYNSQYNRTTKTVLVYAPISVSVQVGDYAKSRNTDEADRIFPGSIVEITHTGCGQHGDPYSIYAKSTGGDRGYFRPRDLRKATDEEVAKARKEAVFTQAGRNPNEYRKGDIVRAINTMATGLEVGHVGAVTGVDRDGDVYLDVKNSGGGKAFYATRSIEPITFAESRLDRN